MNWFAKHLDVTVHEAELVHEAQGLQHRVRHADGARLRQSLPAQSTFDE